MAMKVFATGEVLTASDLNTYGVNTIAAVKTATESVTSSTTLQNDDELVLALAANSTYFLNGIIYYDAGSVGDIKVAFTGPAGATCAIAIVGISTAAVGGGDYAHGTVTAFGSSASFGGTGAGSDRSMTITGTVKIAGTAGNLQFQWTQDTSSAGATRVFALSSLYARRIF